jgi:hypothetical protein
MTTLSPAAQAVFDAADGMEPRQYRGRALAAALRAAVDQVVPDEKAPKMMHLLDLERLAARQHTRARFLAIAAELDGTTPAES